MPRNETQQMTTEDKQKYRNIENYKSALQTIADSDSEKIDLKATKGIKRYCELNQLNFFSILKNFNADLMHDLCEGTITFLLKRFLLHGIDKKIFSEADIKNSIFFFDYGSLNTKVVPSILSIKQKNLGQNASQMKCLMHHIPYIFYHLKDDPEFKEIWECVQAMLKIMQIVFSSTITNHDIQALKEAVTTHLELLKKIFNVKLIPKHHNMTHYASIIALVGPLVHMCTLIFEIKHKEFTTFSRKNNNYINVSKSLATNHQRSAVFRNPLAIHSSNGPLQKYSSTVAYDEVLKSVFTQLDNLSKTKWLKESNIYYENGLILKFENKFFEIKLILHFNSDFYFVCSEYTTVNFNKFLHSVEICEVIPQKYHVIKFSDLNCKKTRNIKIIDERNFVIVDSLDVWSV